MTGYLTLREAAREYPVSYSTLYLAVRRGEIEAYKPGREIVLEAASLQEWFLSKKVRVRKLAGRPRNTTITKI